MIKNTSVVANEDPKVFNYNLKEHISIMQKQGLRVDVQYSSCINKGGVLVYTALLLGHEV